MNGNGSVAFRVKGKPVTQGSKWSPKGSHAVIDQSGDRLESWRQNVGECGSIAWRSPPVKGRVSLHVVFKFQRPQSHMGTGRNATMVKDSAPKYHIQAPDTDKLLRAVMDALTGVIFEDDRQVDDIHGSKQWVTEGGGALIIVDTEPKEES